MTGVTPALSPGVIACAYIKKEVRGNYCHDGVLHLAVVIIGP